ncbi:hypothetical protein IWQ62_001802 [Dispira parvispora]|uniref:Chitin-binding type-1 domain-containing protein n=1 Tax=Dispira parvispora TaxID=1520584 RepID=A0A9W8E7T6_9FUNG|nr:hypothetical protein IWQ62_001802 [Dispira parvispora]
MVKFTALILLAVAVMAPVMVLADDGTCSATKPCANGTCCSGFGFCGSTEAHCGPGCQNGPCTGGGGPSIPPPNGPGTCDATHPCQSGACCSRLGWCGWTDAHCGAGCQNGPCKP